MNGSESPFNSPPHMGAEVSTQIEAFGSLSTGDIPPRTLGTWREFRLQFSGQGALYFRIWIVNLLLTLVTLGLYYPWAKARRLRFFYENTLIDAQPLSFHGDPKQMFKGFLLGLVLFGVYSAVSKFLPDYHWFVLSILALLYPLLVRASRRFMMANIGWHGLRFRFTGTAKDACLGYLPLVAGFALFALLQWAGLGQFNLPKNPKPADTSDFFLLMLAYFMAIAVLVLWVVSRFIAYLQGNLGWGPLQTRFEGRMRMVLGLLFKVGLLYVAALPVMLVVFVAVVFLRTNLGDKVGVKLPQLGLALNVSVGVLLLVAVVAVITLIAAYVQSRKQNLIWNPTRADHLRIQSGLRCRPLWYLKFKNWLLIVATLGLYAPYAAVAIAKMRIESVVIASDLDFDAIAAHSARMSGSATGEAVADLFDLDLGL